MLERNVASGKRTHSRVQVDEASMKRGPLQELADSMIEISTSELEKNYHDL
jgi:hypothetical protein